MAKKADIGYSCADGEYIRQVVDRFPPLTTAQRTRLAVLLDVTPLNGAAPGLDTEGSFNTDPTLARTNHSEPTSAA
jgi:hypothetical protein